jgi:hypothetical protein
MTLLTLLKATTGGGGVAFTVTARHSGNSGTTSAQTRATNSTTPTANSLFLVAWSSEHDAVATAPAFQTPTGGGLTYTQVRTAGDVTTYPWNGDDAFRVGSAVYRADVGGSPSAFVVTVDSFSTTSTAFYGVVCLDITGHDTSTPIVGTPGIAGGSKAAGNAETGTVTLGATPTAGNLIVVVFGAGADSGGGFVSPTAGVGKTFTTVTNQTNSFCQTGVFYRVADGTESTTITCSDLGQQVGNYSAIAIEIKAAAGGGSTVNGAAVGAFGFTGTTSGIPRTSGAAIGSLGFTASAAGIDRARGAALAAFGYTATAVGVDRVLGSAVATFGFTATATGNVGTPAVTGQASVLLGFTATASGIPRTSGVAAAAFGFTGSAAGVDRSLGSATAVFGFTATASGRPRVRGATIAAMGFTATATGVPDVHGAAIAGFGFTATAQGFAGTPPVTGSAVAAFGFTAAADGQPRTSGAAIAVFGFTATTVGRPRKAGASVAVFGFTGTVAGKRRVLGIAQALLGFTALANGQGATVNAQSLATVTDPRGGVATVTTPRTSTTAVTARAISEPNVN